MGKRKLIIFIVLLCCINIILEGCKTTRNTLKKFDEENTETIRKGIDRNKNDYKTVWIKRYNCEVREKWKTRNFYGGIKIVKDKGMLITIKSGIGMETARILLTKDSVKIVDRIHKEIYTGVYAKMQRYFTLVDGYKEIENLLLCNNYMIIEELEKNKGYKIESIEGKKKTEFMISEIGINEKGMKKYTIGNDNWQMLGYLKENKGENGEENRLKINYIGWIEIGRFKLPKGLKIEINRNDEKTVVILEYEKTEINTSVEIKLENPDGYKVINL